MLAPALAWESAARFTSDGSPATLASGIQVPAHTYAFEVHPHLDADAAGTSATIASGDVDIWVERLQSVTRWAQQTGNKLFLGEVGVGPDTASTTALANMLSYMRCEAELL